MGVRVRGRVGVRIGVLGLGVRVGVLGLGLGAHLGEVRLGVDGHQALAVEDIVGTWLGLGCGLGTGLGLGLSAPG